MARQKSKEKELQWRDVLRRQANSGLSIRQFCARERISQPSFYAWRRRLRESADGERTSRTVSRRVEPAASTGEFVSLKLLAPTSTWEVIHPQGYRVRVRGEVNAASLRCVFGALDGREQG
jgi:hypothetical protein